MFFSNSETPQEKGTKILSHVRNLIEQAANNADELFLINRFVFARLQLDERKGKKKIKAEIFNEKPFCFFCKKQFSTIKNIDLHRQNESQGYHSGNCVLACKTCHNEIHLVNSKELEPDTKSTAKKGKSVSGKYKFIRHLVEDLLIENPDIHYEEMKKAVLEEFPESAFNKSHYSWYLNKIIVNQEFKYAE